MYNYVLNKFSQIISHKLNKPLYIICNSLYNSLLSYRFIIFMIFSFISLKLGGQVVNIPDSNFFSALLERNIDFNNDGYISISEALAVKNLDLENEGIMDLNGIQAFQNIEKLNISKNPLEILELGDSIALKLLNIRETKINNLNLTNWDRLYSLNISKTPLKRLEIPTNNVLTHIYIDDNADLKTLILHNAAKLEKFNSTFFNTSYNLDTLIIDSLFHEIAVLEDDVNEYLELRNIFNVSVINNFFSPNYFGTMIVFNAPQTIQLGGNHLEHMEIDQLPLLQGLSILNVKTEFLDLSNFPELRRFRIQGKVDSLLCHKLQYVQNVSIGDLILESEYVLIQDLTNLNELTIESGDIQNLVIKDLPKLTNLDIHSNNIKQFEIQNIPKLKNIKSVGNNNIDFDVNNFPDLNKIFLSSCIIRSFILKNNDVIESIVIKSDSLRNLQLSNVTKLYKLKIDAPFSYVKMRALPKLINPDLYRIQKLEFNDQLVFKVQDLLNCSTLNIDTLILDNISDSDKIELSYFDFYICTFVRNCPNLTFIESQYNRDFIYIENLPKLDRVHFRWNKGIEMKNVPKLRDVFISSSLELKNIDLNLTGSNMLKSITITNTGMENIYMDSLDLSHLQFLNLANNKLSKFNLFAQNPKMLVDLRFNKLTTFEYSSTQSIKSLDCNLAYNQLKYFILADVPGQSNFNLTYNKLKAIFTHQDSLFMNFEGNPDLSYICVVPSLYNLYRSYANLWVGLDKCTVDSTCTLPPPSKFSIVEAYSYWKYGNEDSCKINNPYPYVAYDVTLDKPGFTNIFSSNENPTSIIVFYEGELEIKAHSQSLLSQEEFNKKIYVSNDEIQTVSFCFDVEDACDIGVQLFGLERFSPGFDTKFDIIIKNMGTVATPVQLTMNFDPDIQQYISSDLPPLSQENGIIFWEVPSIKGLDEVRFSVWFRLNSPMDNPPLKGQEKLDYKVQVESECQDYNDRNNIFYLEREVRNSFDPNDKTCLEGSILDYGLIGDYVHYLIRCENTGTAEAAHITIQDIIDTLSFDINTIEIVDASDPVQLKVAGNMASFIFQDINLPFEDSSNDAYVLFRIKSKSNLVIGDVLNNSAKIFFDYNFPIETNTISSVFDIVNSYSNIILENKLLFYPNPIINFVKIKSDIPFNKMEIYTTNGNILQSKNLQLSTYEYSWSIYDLAVGTYWIALFEGNQFIGGQMILVH